MAISPTRHRFNRTMALAIAAGITLTGGVQVAYETNVAQADTTMLEAFPILNLEAGYATHVAPYGNTQLDSQLLVRRDDAQNTTNIIQPINAVAPVNFTIKADKLLELGFDLKKPFTVKEGSTTVTGNETIGFINTNGITEKVTPQETTFNHGYEGIVYKSDGTIHTPSSYGISVEQDGKRFNIAFIPYGLELKMPTVVYNGESTNREFTVPVGGTLTVEAPNPHKFEQGRLKPIGITDEPNEILTPSFKVVGPDDGVEANEDGSFKFTPIENQKGQTFEVSIYTDLDNLNFGYTQPFKDTNMFVIGRYRITVPNDAASIKDNGDGTFSFNDGTANAEDITINTKDGVQNVTKQGNTLVFTMADGNTKKIDVAANITLKQNNDGTATISDGKTTLTVATANTYVDKVEKNAKGDYVLTRNDKQTFTINLQDIRNDIDALKKKDSPSRKEHNDVKDSVDKLRDQLSEFAGKNSESLEDLADQISEVDGKIDTTTAEFKRELTGISTDLQDLEFRVERTENRLIKEVRDNHDGTFTLVTEKYGDIPGVIDASSGVTNIISNSDGTITMEFAGKEPRTIDLHQVEVTETGKGTPKHTITIKVPGEEPFRFNAFDTYVTNIETDNKGKYTLKLNNGETVEGVIDTSKGIVNIENRADGSIVLVRTDGTKSKPIKLEQVKITHENEGTKDHTITIKVPGGETVTLDAYDNFVTSVKKVSDGVYEITRNDGQKWTINITDLYKRVADLEAKDSPTRDEFNAVKKDIANYKKLVDKRFTKVEGDVTELRADLTAVEHRVTALEARVTKVENTQKDLAKCLDSAGLTAIPAALSLPLMFMAHANLPGVAEMNTQIQQQIGVYDANLAKMWGEHGGVLQMASAVAALAGVIGGIAYIANECTPYVQSDAAKDTTFAQLSSKRDARKAEREARAKARAEARETKQAA